MKRSQVPTLILLLATLAGCAPDDAGPSEEQLRQRQLAAREACIAERLVQQAHDELTTLEALGVASGPVGFQRAYVHHAELRLTALAHLDSALNHSANTADSARHVQQASAIQIRNPDPESVESNVIRSYEVKAAAIFNDADHPCNWQAELEGDA